MVEDRLFHVVGLDVVLDAVVEGAQPLEVVVGALGEDRGDGVVVGGDAAEPHGQHAAARADLAEHVLVGEQLPPLGAQALGASLTTAASSPWVSTRSGRAGSPTPPIPSGREGCEAAVMP